MGVGGVNVVPPSDLTECQETAKMENQHLQGGSGLPAGFKLQLGDVKAFGSSERRQPNAQTFLQIHGTLHPSTQQVYTPTEKRRSPPGWQRFRLNHHTPSIRKKKKKPAKAVRSRVSWAITGCLTT